MTPGRLARLVLIGLLVFVAACRSLPPVRYYTLAPPTLSGEVGNPWSEGEGLTVGVETLTVDPPYDQDRLVYRQGRDSDEVGFYAYHRWSAPLGRMLQVALAEGLAGVSGISSAQPAGSAGNFDARLTGRLLYLEEVDLPDAIEARVGMALELSDLESGTIWSATVSGDARGRAIDGAEVVGLVQEALAELIGQVRGEIAAALQKNGGS